MEVSVETPLVVDIKLVNPVIVAVTLLVPAEEPAICPGTDARIHVEVPLTVAFKAPLAIKLLVTVDVLEIVPANTPIERPVPTTVDVPAMLLLRLALP